MKILVLICAFVFTFFIPAKNEALYFDRTIRGGLYFPTNHSKCVIPYWSPFLQFETNFHFADCWTQLSWTGWANIGVVAGLGHFCHTHSAFLIPISGGLKYSWCIGRMRELYVGLGLTYAYLTSRGSNGVSRSGMGGVFKFGCRQYYWDSYFGELFLDYQYTHFKHRKLYGIFIGFGWGRLF